MQRMEYFFLLQLLIFYEQCEIGNSIYGENVRRTNFQEYSYVVPFVRMKQHGPIEENVVCSGSLITSLHVLTAAHCFDYIKEDPFFILIGSNDLYRSASYFPCWYTTYEQWAAAVSIRLEFNNNDIGLTKLVSNMPLRLFQAPLSRISQKSLLFGLSAVMVGWGKKSAKEFGNALQVANVTILSTEQCNSRTAAIRGYEVVMPSSFLCTVADPCVLSLSGDSGGPLLYGDQIIGVTVGRSPVENEDKINLLSVNIHIGIAYYMSFINANLLM